MLDQTAKLLEQSKGAEAKFRLTAYVGTPDESKTEGDIKMQGRKFNLTSPEMTTWFDGKTQWTMLTGTNEVNLQEPSDEELARMNPYAFISLYRQGYKCKLKKNVELRDTKTYEVRLLATDSKMDLQTIIVNIDMQTYKPICIRLQHEKEWVRIAIYDLHLDRTYTPDTFVFPTDKYPETTIIDLRL